jgi:hypothetical protein
LELVPEAVPDTPTVNETPIMDPVPIHYEPTGDTTIMESVISPPIPVKDGRKKVPREESVSGIPRINTRYNLRTTVKPKIYALMKARLPPLMDGKLKRAMRERPKETLVAAVDEIGKFLEKKAFKGVMLEEIKVGPETQILSSMMFITDKYLPNGTYEKTKARLVAGGHQQLRDPADNIYSPTMPSFALFTIAAIAGKQNRIVEAWDVGSAYLNAGARPDKPTYIRLDPICTGILCEMDQSYTSFKRNDGSIIMKVSVAIYGLIESAKLWNEELHKTLSELDFIRNPVEPCVYNRTTKHGQMTIGIYVDDIFASASAQSDLDEVYNALVKRYVKVNRRAGKVIPFLGMELNFSLRDQVSISMSGYINDLLKSSQVEGCASSPACNDLYDVNDSARKLTPDRVKWFYSCVFKCLYLTERIRPDCKVAVAYLTTRVQNPTVEDELKLKRVIMYIRQTMHEPLTLRVSDDLQCTAYIDASYGVHADVRSHSGLFITLGGGAIYARSVKQKINTKSSTEAELMALSDQSSQVIHTRDFLIAQGAKEVPAIIYQDNKSTLALIKRGAPTSDHTKHINIRHFWVADRVRTEEVELRYMPTKDMVADILTKPLQGRDLRKLRGLILGTTSDEGV